jgi:outer membrane protein OmpA-like peptidoglycan-associated protein
MRCFTKHLSLALTLGGTLLVQVIQAQAPADRRNFVSCPIVRDTKTQPCWLAEYDGVTYYLGQQSGVANDFYPGQQMHQLLVEGTVASGPKVCGAVPLRPVKISVLQELNPACTVILPAEDGIEAPPPPPPPALGLAPSWVKVEGSSTTIYFDFNNEFLSVHSNIALNKIANDVKQSKPMQIEITGYRASSLLSNGQTMTERAGVGNVRAQKVAGILIGLGVPKEIVVVNAPADPVKADGANDPWNRRVVVNIKK